ncbi:uncharacterized protein LOC144608757 [Rhinoraja longicauda]
MNNWSQCQKYKREICNMIEWCQNHNLAINDGKTKESPQTTEEVEALFRNEQTREDFAENVSGIVSKFAGGTKIVGAVASEEGCLRLPQVLEQLGKQAKEWQIEFNAARCKEMYFGRLYQAPDPGPAACPPARPAIGALSPASAATPRPPAGGRTERGRAVAAAAILGATKTTRVREAASMERRGPTAARTPRPYLPPPTHGRSSPARPLAALARPLGSRLITSFRRYQTPAAPTYPPESPLSGNSVPVSLRSLRAPAIYCVSQNAGVTQRVMMEDTNSMLEIRESRGQK